METGQIVVVRYTGWLDGAVVGEVGALFDGNMKAAQEPLVFTVGESEVCAHVAVLCMSCAP